jgi:hypothetical protein
MPATLLCAGLPTQNSPCEHRPAPMPAQPCPPRPPRPGPGLGHLRGRGRAPLGQPTGTHLPPEPVGGGRRPCPADRGTTCQRFQRPARPGPGGHAGAGRCGGGGPPGPASGVHHAAAGGCTGPLGARGDRDSSCRDVEVLWLPASSGWRWPRPRAGLGASREHRPDAARRRGDASPGVGRPPGGNEGAYSAVGVTPHPPWHSYRPLAMAGRPFPEAPVAECLAVTAGQPAAFLRKRVACRYQP